MLLIGHRSQQFWRHTVWTKNSASWGSFHVPFVYLEAQSQFSMPQRYDFSMNRECSHFGRGSSVTVWLTSCFTSLDLTNHVFCSMCCLVEPLIFYVVKILKTGSSLVPRRKLTTLFAQVVSCWVHQIPKIDRLYTQKLSQFV